MIHWKIAEPKTLWWTNGKHRLRQDVLIGFMRVYSRKDKKYLYRFTFFRFTIGWMK